MSPYFGVPGLEGLWFEGGGSAGTGYLLPTRRRIWYRGEGGRVRSSTCPWLTVSADGRRVSQEAWQDIAAELGRAFADRMWGPPSSWRRP